MFQYLKPHLENRALVRRHLRPCHQLVDGVCKAGRGLVGGQLGGLGVGLARHLRLVLLDVVHHGHYHSACEGNRYILLSFKKVKQTNKK